MKNWICRKCEQEVMATERPAPIKWTDGHICVFVEDHKYTKNSEPKNESWDMVGLVPKSWEK